MYISVEKNQVNSKVQWEEVIARGPLLDNLHDVSALLTAGPTGLFLDLDGTLSEIVPEPDAATVSASIMSALTKLRHKFALVVIVTGRSAIQAQGILGMSDLLIVGNHGLERLEKGQLSPVEESRPFSSLLGQLRIELSERLTTEGLLFEDKGSSFAIHYRLAENPDGARDAVLRAVEELAGDKVKVLMGKTVINVLPPIEFTKGTALTSLVAEYGLSGAIVMGDDVTDLDAFRAASSLSRQKDLASLSIAVVGIDSPPELEQEADLTLSSVSEVEGFLSWLVDQMP